MTALVVHRLRSNASVFGKLQAREPRVQMKVVPDAPGVRHLRRVRPGDFAVVRFPALSIDGHDDLETVRVLRADDRQAYVVLEIVRCTADEDLDVIRAWRAAEAVSP